MGILTVSIEAKHEFSYTDISDLLSCAFDGGISYWCQGICILSMPENVNEDTFDNENPFASDVVSFGGTLVVNIIDEDESQVLTIEKFMKGIKMYCENYDMLPSELIDNHDADVADIIMQYALFDEQVYG